MDVILVGSSELSSPHSPGLRKGEGALRDWTRHLGCQRQAWAAPKNVPDACRARKPGCLTCQERRGGGGSSGSCDFRRPTVTRFSAVFKWQIRRRRKGPLTAQFSFPDLIAYEVKVNQRDIEGEWSHACPQPGKGDASQLWKGMLRPHTGVRPWKGTETPQRPCSPPFHRPSPQSLA